METNNIYIHKEASEIVKGLYGSEIAHGKACGYCKRHGCYLTVKMLRQHDCLNKQCYHLIKNEDHQWWKQREEIKQKRKARKLRYNSCVNI